MSWAYLNNAFHKKEEVRISPYDRGFLFGDGVYEVIPSYAGKPFLYEEHISRLSKSLNEVSINKPEQWEHLKSIIEDLLKKRTQGLMNPKQAESCLLYTSDAADE